jgi:hypothetical protein
MSSISNPSTSSTTIIPVPSIPEPTPAPLVQVNSGVQPDPTYQRLLGAAFPQKLLNVGFGLALLLAAGCLTLGAIYLYTFLKSTNVGIEQLVTQAGSSAPDGVLQIAINGRLVMARIALLSCGVFAGMSFGFLGFALFLFGVKEEMNVTAHSERYSVKLAQMAPGVFVIVCAAILIGVCVYRETPFTYMQEKAPTASSQTAGTVSPTAGSQTAGTLPVASGSPRSGTRSNPTQPSIILTPAITTVTTTTSAAASPSPTPSPA